MRAENLERDFKYEEVARIRYSDIPNLEKEVKDFESKLDEIASSGESYLRDKVDTEDIAKIMTVQNSLLVKLHGEADSATKRVLTKNEYNNFYTASNTLKLCIETITYNSLLFLGCSLSTDRTIKTMI